MSDLNTKICPRCGKEFKRPKNYSPANWRRRINCSRTCAVRETAEEALIRFRSNYSEADGCWEWHGHRFNHGYGSFSAVNLGIKTNELAHRAQFFLCHGFMPSDPYVIMHSCDNPVCVRPDHLSLGTDKENTDDMDAKGRRNQARGEQVGSSKLTSAEVKAIRARRADGETLTAIARDYGVSHNLISMIARGKVWSWLSKLSTAARSG